MESLSINGRMWMLKNIRVMHFNNGDPITFARNQNEWAIAAQENLPAMCSASDFGGGDEVFYNWHVLNDPRGIAPVGWRLPLANDFRSLINSGLSNIDEVFNAYLTGFRAEDGLYYQSGYRSRWWASNTHMDQKDKAYYMEMDEDYWFTMAYDNKGIGAFIRFVEDK